MVVRICSLFQESELFFDKRSVRIQLQLRVQDVEKLKTVMADLEIEQMLVTCRQMSRPSHEVRPG